MRLKYIAVCGIALIAISACAVASQASTLGRRFYVSTVFSWWPTYKDPLLFEKFVRESKQKGMNSISIDIPWTVRGNDGKYDFSVADSRIDHIVSQGMSVFIKVNTTTLGDQVPKWLTEDMLQRTKDGEIYRRKTDSGTLPSLAHPIVRDRIVRFFREVARHYGSRYSGSIAGDYPVVCLSPAFDLYMRSEYFPDADVDYSAAAEEDFSRWMRREYRSLSDLNDKWSRDYSSWDAIKLKEAHETARHLYFEWTLLRILDGIANAVRSVSELEVALQTGCLWDNPHRRTTNVAALTRKMDWLFTVDSPGDNHAFSTDYARTCAPNVRIASGVDAATHAEATNGRYFNQGVRAFEHGASAIVLANWDLSNMSDNNRWPFLHFVGKLTRYPAARPNPAKAIYVSTWDLINRSAEIAPYLSAYENLSDGGKSPVDVLSDHVLAKDPGRLSGYTEIYLPANWTIPADVRKALSAVKDKLKVSRPLTAGTLDEYGRATQPLIQP